MLVTKRLTEIPDKMNKVIRKKGKKHNIFRHKREYCLNQNWKKWKFLITIKKKKCCQEVYIIRKGFKPQTLLIIDMESYTEINKDKVLQR